MKTFIITQLLFPFSVVLAHEADEDMHMEEEAVTVDPVLLGGGLLGAAIIGFLLWKFVLHKQ